jgi:DNA-directed RNA polymerase subunit RPC12/RpoP
MPKRLYDKCQKCGGEFTDEHHFAKYCKKCNPKAVASGIKKVTKSGERMLSESEMTIRFLDYSVGVKCLNCNREIDIIHGRSQDFENVCPGCGKHYEAVFGIREKVTKE